MNNVALGLGGHTLKTNRCLINEVGQNLQKNAQQVRTCDPGGGFRNRRKPRRDGSASSPTCSQCPPVTPHVTLSSAHTPGASCAARARFVSCALPAFPVLATLPQHAPWRYRDLPCQQVRAGACAEMLAGPPTCRPLPRPTLGPTHVPAYWVRLLLPSAAICSPPSTPRGKRRFEISSGASIMLFSLLHYKSTIDRQCTKCTGGLIYINICILQNYVGNVRNLIS